MTDGELKKRVSDKFFQCLEEDYMPIKERNEPEMVEVNASIHWDDLKEILDEAKKEFPKPNLNKFITDYHEIKAMRAWFKKWFGDSP